MQTVRCHCGAVVRVTETANGFSPELTSNYHLHCVRLKETLQASGNPEPVFVCPDLMRIIQTQRTR